jgi:hypothetical protein
MASRALEEGQDPRPDLGESGGVRTHRRTGEAQAASSHVEALPTPGS